MAVDEAALVIDELHATLGRLDLALGFARDAFAWTDQRGCIVWCNHAFDVFVRADHLALLGAPIADRLLLMRDGKAIAEAAHPARRVLTEQREIAETYEVAIGEASAVVDVYARRGSIQGEPAAVLVIQDVTDRAQAQAELRLLNARLEAANSELEAFSYSVSHDLRTPLRAIDGFSHALLEDYGAVLDEEGKDYLHRLRGAAQGMGRLIDDMLRLSRVTRGELAWAEVDLSALCRTIAAELQAAAPDRTVKLTIPDGLLVHGDERLLRQALHNLLENAWKFTSRSVVARIEVGALREDGEHVFFVRDNGAGFDMARADKLFGAFQRLHTSEEFPGMGIGLAIVRRIVHRHGGRVWAESVVGEGATFYFTLPGAWPGEEPELVHERSE